MAVCPNGCQASASASWLFVLVHGPNHVFIYVVIIILEKSELNCIDKQIIVYQLSL